MIKDLEKYNAEELNRVKYALFSFGSNRRSQNDFQPFTLERRFNKILKIAIN